MVEKYTQIIYHKLQVKSILLKLIVSVKVNFFILEDVVLPIPSSDSEQNNNKEVDGQKIIIH